MTNFTSFITERYAFLAANYLAVLTIKKIGGFDLAVLTSQFWRIAIAGAGSAQLINRHLKRIFILSPLSRYSFYD